MRKLLLLTLLSVPFVSLAQYRWDFGLNLGGTSYLGEIGGGAGLGKHFGPADLKWQKTRFILGGFARYKYKQYLSFKGSLNYIRLSGDDALTANPERRNRNLSFVNGLVEAEGVAQFFFAQIRDVGGSYKYRNDIRFFVFGGISGFYNNPKAEYGGSLVALRPLKTEGKGYSPVNLGFPAGLGAYITIQRIIRVGIEMAYVKTLTDYIDDVSTVYADDATLGNDPTRIALANRSAEYTEDPFWLAQHAPGQIRGNPKYKDAYLYTALTGSYVMKGKSAFYKARYGHAKGKGFKKRRIRAKF